MDPSYAQEVELFTTALRVERNASVHTQRNYRIDLHDFGRWALRADVDPLSPTHRQLRRYLADLDAAQYARTTVNRRLSALRSFYRWRVIAQRADHDPGAALASLKQAQRLPHRIKQADMDLVLQQNAPRAEAGADDERTPQQLRDQALVELLYATGARIGEAAGLRIADVDLVQLQVRLVGKGDKERIVPLHRKAAESLRAYLERGRPALMANHRPHDRFFASTRGNPWSAEGMRATFKRAVAEAGVAGSYTPHDMRHTFASDVLEGGADLRSVQEMLGHSSLSTTQIYTHLSPDALRRAHAQAHPRG